MGTDIHFQFQKKTEYGWANVSSQYEGNRHYQLFAVLADVRNGYGTAGCVTGEVVKPIAMPRGLPEGIDVTADFGDYSFSWLSGQEMLAWYEKSPVILQRGVLDRREYDSWDKKSCPSSYSGDVFGSDVIKIHDNEREKQEKPMWNYIICEWYSPLSEELAYFFEEVKRLVDKHGEIRFVFGFDS